MAALTKYQTGEVPKGKQNEKKKKKGTVTMGNDSREKGRKPYSTVCCFLFAGGRREGEGGGVGSVDVACGPLCCAYFFFLKQHGGVRPKGPCFNKIEDTNHFAATG